MIKPLKLGSTGAIVTQWQDFLRGQGYLLDSTGQFDAATDVATRAFQARYKLTVDGQVGNQTYGKAAMLHFELVDFAESDSSYPARPNFSPLVSNAERQKLLGPLEFIPEPTAKNPEALRITNGWDASHLVKVNLPQLVGIKGAPASASIWFHALGAKQMQGLWSAWAKRGLLHLVLSFDGAYNPRFVRGKAAQQILSNHAFGSAFDINASYNRMGGEPATPSETGCLYELVPVAHEFGFYWGGHFSRRDGMHFELAKIL